ncbi:MAG: hypothetical protein HKN57_00640 [Xanthomonadales bacterium]|nr:hypothetical protein [Gammaproteobacteria bacterium]MBT8054644.1 hypothetical protein [Gammaproteobacteria bacterium]NND55734.1 hypothetical protein [Xanthomonadales bacterium]NNK50145.1 hypothetical protein [Xanthomonadales bacterium]NNL94435.1 hypothetical protein [Xanthomonadales bacterium]
MNQQGVALLAGLVLMAAVSLLALSAASGMVLQRSMASNFQESMLALQNASIASAYAQAWLFSRSDHERERGCQIDCLLPMAIHEGGTLPMNPEFESAAWWRNNAIPAGYNPATAQMEITPAQGAEPALWLIEEVHYESTGETEHESHAGGQAFYRIVSRGTGLNARSVVVTETIVARPWEGDFSAGPYPPNGPVETFCRQFDDVYACGHLAWRQTR